MLLMQELQRQNCEAAQISNLLKGLDEYEGAFN